VIPAFEFLWQPAGITDPGYNKTPTAVCKPPLLGLTPLHANGLLNA
jgi:hypothetical protein